MQTEMKKKSFELAIRWSNAASKHSRIQLIMFKQLLVLCLNLLSSKPFFSEDQDFHTSFLKKRSDEKKRQKNDVELENI